MVTKFCHIVFRLNFYNIKNLLLDNTKGPAMKKSNVKQLSSTPPPKTPSWRKSPTPTWDAKSKIEVLLTPRKSLNDKKDYKVIRLENGLTACLISDMVKPVNVEELLAKDSDDESSSESDESSNSSEDDDKSESSEDEGRTKHLAKSRKHSDDEVKLAAAALCVGVGSFSDDKEVPGLAHFLEHMVFMGSKKFPQENDFDSFIKKHGGSDNASTDYEVTTFHFECLEKHLNEGMDKFAQFFIAPLMKRESMAREREAVESEFQMAVPSDDYRKEQLLVSLAKDPSPINSFSWGNLVTLRDNISDDQLYETLHEFRKRHYSAHRMTVAVQARLPMEILEAYVLRNFSDIPNNGLPADNFKQYTQDILDTPEFRKLYYVKPVKDVCQVDLTWVMPSLQHLYKSKPHVYVSWLLGHEGKGSLLSYLKKKVWAMSLYAGNGESGAEFNSIYATFSVNIVLTKEGFAHLQDVIAAVFSYLQLLKDVGPNERIFKEIQRIEEVSFQFEEEESASDKVEEMVENMQMYPPEDYLTGSELFFEYNPDAIRMILNQLVPDKMNIMIMSSDLPDSFIYDKTEKWFKTKYAASDIHPDWLRTWLSAKPLPDFWLPEPNPFLTEDFSLLPVDANLPDYPQKIIETSMAELWYRKDQKFEFPMAYYYYYIIYPQAMESVESSCMNLMFVVFLNMNLAEEGYAAQLAELSYSIFASEKGICLKISGFNEKLPVLIELITKYIKSVSSNLTPDVFEAVKEKQAKSFYNSFLKPSKLCKDVRLYVLQDNYYLYLERYTVISKITFEMMKEFSENVLKHVYVQGLIQGNVSKEVAVQTTKKLLAELDLKPLSSEHCPKIMVKEVPKGERCCRIMSFNQDNSNSIITNYYQCGLVNIRENVILDFILLLIEEPLFDILRTKEQLGYSVSCAVRDTYGVLGYSITVNTQADKHTTQHVDARIEAFIKHTHKILKKLSEKKFQETKHDLIKMKLHADMELEDEVVRNWDEIVSLKYEFNRLKLEIEAVEQLRMGEVKKWWDEHNMQDKKNNLRKLSIQVVGHKPKESPSDSKTSIQKTSNPEEMVHLAVRPSSGTSVDSQPGESVNYYQVKPFIDDRNADDDCDASTKVETSFSLNFLENKEEIGKNNKKEDYFITDVGNFRAPLKTYLDTPEAKFNLAK